MDTPHSDHGAQPAPSVSAARSETLGHGHGSHPAQRMSLPSSDVSQVPPAGGASPVQTVDSAQTVAAHTGEHESAPAQTESNALLVAGGLFTLFGLAIATAPEYSWSLTKIGQALHAAGIESGMLIVGGLVLLAVGLLARQRTQPVAVVAASKGPDEDSDFRLVADQLSTKINRLSTSSLQVSEDVTVMAEVQKSLFSKIEGKDGLALEHRDALFRLAASLDKLNAHFDERFHALDLQVRSGLDSVIHALNQTRHHLEARLSASDSQPSSKMSPGFSPSTPTNEELHVLVDLEEPTSIPTTTAEESADFFGTSLERLDELAGGLDTQPQPPGPVPGSPLDSPRHVPDANKN